MVRLATGAVREFGDCGDRRHVVRRAYCPAGAVGRGSLERAPLAADQSGEHGQFRDARRIGPRSGACCAHARPCWSDGARLAALPPEDAEWTDDLLAEVRSGINIVELRRVRAAVPAGAENAIEMVLANTARYLRSPSRSTPGRSSWNSSTVRSKPS